MTDLEDPEQWQRERDYFDHAAENVEPYDLPLIAARYEKAMASPLYPLEVAYAFMGKLEGKRVLDVGCGNGENSVLFAHWGAQVTGVDIAPKALEIARQRAAAAGVSERTKFLAMPFERVAEQESKFDIVWSAAFLHHVLDRLDDVAAQLLRNTRQDGRLIVLEPIRKSSLLKRIRAVIPPYPTGTPDERPLENEDFAKLTKIFATQSLRYFGPISRIAVRAMQSEKYETAGYLKRTVADSMHRLDKIVVNHTPLRRSAMVVVGSLTPRHS